MYPKKGGLSFQKRIGSGGYSKSAGGDFFFSVGHNGGLVSAVDRGWVGKNMKKGKMKESVGVRGKKKRKVYKMTLSLSCLVTFEEEKKINCSS